MLQVIEEKNTGYSEEAKVSQVLPRLSNGEGVKPVGLWSKNSRPTTNKVTQSNYGAPREMTSFLHESIL